MRAIARGCEADNAEMWRRPDGRWKPTFTDDAPAGLVPLATVNRLDPAGSLPPGFNWPPGLMAIHQRPGQGTVFAASATTWVGALSADESRTALDVITRNVIERLRQPQA